ncbi:MAG: LamG domain-containing protein [Planctomycetaceae bacterium]|nr:LamG domain-containing protein [Planctomycetaceae bacterium]
MKTPPTAREIMSWGSTDSCGKWIVRVNDNGTLRAEVQGGYIYGATPVNDGTWHHVAVVLADDGSTNISEAKLYVDGVPDTIGGVSSCTVNTASYYNVNIGVFPASAHYFQGLIDEVRIYNAALTDSEVLDLANE